MGDETARRESGKHSITTVTCKACGVLYVQSDQDGSDFQHFCEMQTMAPATKPPEAPKSGVDTSASDVTVLHPSQVDGGTTQRRMPVSSSAEAGFPEEVKQASRDPARLVKQYILVKQIGKGGMGTVWKGWDRNLSRWVAIKFLTGDTQEEVDRFNREAKVAASVRHPNIASIFDVGEARGQHYIAMEFIDGTSMDQIKVPIRDLVEMMRQVSLAMDTAHKAGIIHRDLKPQNIMVTKQGWPFVLDFGLAKQVSGGGQNLSVTGTIMGTPAFMPPEQAQGQSSKIDARSDVYSLGATLYSLVTKQIPFKGETPMDTVLKVIKEEPVDPCKLNKDCPPEVSTIVLKAMEKEAERRYQSAAEFAEDLRRYLHDESLLAKPPSIHYKIVKNLQRNKLKYALGGTIVIAAVVVTVLMVMVGTKKTTFVGAEEQVFRDEWKKVSGPISFLDYAPEKVDLATFNDAFEKLKQLKVDQVKASAVEWFEKEARSAETKLKDLGDDRKLWIRNRDDLDRISQWTREVQNVLDGLKKAVPDKAAPFKDLYARFSTIGLDAGKMAGYQGQANLRIHVAPFARVKSLKSGTIDLVKDGKIVPSPDVKFPDPDLSTPLVLQDLEIRDYDLELECEGIGTRIVKIQAGQMKNGADYIVSGHMSQPASLTLKSIQ